MRFVLPTLALAAVAAPALAAPQTNEETVSVRIDVADIDLATSEGRAELEARIDAKLRKACTIESAARYTYGRDVIDQKCVADARATALAQAERVASARARSSGQASAN